MSTKHFTANVISASKVVPDGNYSTSAASGVWTLDEQLDLVKGDNWPNAGNIAPGQNEYTSFGNYTFVAPAGYTSISVVCIGAGGAGGVFSTSPYRTGGGGGGGELRYKNNVSVTAGESYTVVVGRAYNNAVSGANDGSDGGASTFNSSTCVANGGLGGDYINPGGGRSTGPGGAGGSGGTGDGGGNGGAGATCTSSGYGGGGGGAGGYAGAGGAGGVNGNAGSDGAGGGAGGGGSSGGSGYGNIKAAAGGGTGLLGQGSNGSGGAAGDNNTNNSSGGGGGSGGTAGSISTGGNYGGGSGGAGGNTIPKGGAVRIMWPGNTRTYPSTNTADV